MKLFCGERISRSNGRTAVGRSEDRPPAAAEADALVGGEVEGAMSAAAASEVVALAPIKPGSTTWRVMRGNLRCNLNFPCTVTLLYTYNTFANTVPRHNTYRKYKRMSR